MTGTPVPPPLTKPEYTYVVGPGDILSIEVWKEPELRRDVGVDPDGRITFPLAGYLSIMDRTLPDIQDLLTTRLREVLTEPLVSVTLRESRSAQIQMLGEVGRQGPIPFHDRLSVIQAIALAGGPHWPTAATTEVRIIRGALDDPMLIEVNMNHVLIAAEKDVFLRPGDIVLVPTKWVTSFDRYLTQILSPIRNIAGAGREASGVGLQLAR